MTNHLEVASAQATAIPRGRPSGHLHRLRPTVIRFAPLGTVAAITAAAAVRDPHAPGSWGICPTLAIFGIDCPGCGSLRALHDLTAGNWSEAMGHNVLVAPAVLFIGYASIRRPGARWSLVWTVAFLLFTLLRNLPDSPLAA